MKPRQLEAIDEILSSPAGHDEATGLLGMAQLRRCGQHLLSYLNEAVSNGCFALIVIDNTERSYIYGGVDTNLQCWRTIVEVIAAELPTQAYMARVSAGIAIHAWGEDVERTMSGTLHRIQAKLVDTTFIFPTRQTPVRINLSSRVGYLIYPEDSGHQSNFSEVTRMVALTCLTTTAVEERSSSIKRYRESLARSAERFHRIEERVHHALRASSFKMYFQPKLDISTREVTGAEALARWNDEVLGVVEPADFISVLERSRNIIAFTTMTLRQAAAFTARNVAVFPEGFRCSVNISQSIFNWNDADVVGMIRSALEEFSCPPSLLEIEITESAYFSRDISEYVIDVLRQVQSLGVSVAIDDFGSGYGALSLITSRVARVIKIDRRLSAELLSEETESKFLKCLIYSAREAGIEIIVEGIEEAWQEEKLRELNIEFGQGHLYAEALCEDDFLSYLSVTSGAVAER